MDQTFNARAEGSRTTRLRRYSAPAHHLKHHQIPLRRYGGGYTATGHSLLFLLFTREGVLRSLIGSKTRGLESDSYLNHSTGVGRVNDADWTDTPNGRVKPVYKDAILNKRDLRVALTLGGGADGTVREIDEMTAVAKDGSDTTNYMRTATRYFFKTHWARLLGI